nr:hypothetical protein [Tanacetum cinerariifolium]
MALTFADTHNMIAYLTKSDASKGFEQILDFLNASVIQYALTVNPTIYVSCIKQFWSSVSLKKTNDVIRLQALIDRRKVIITEDTVRQALRLDDAKSIDCLPNEEMFAELETMGYEKPSTKLTFYKAFFSAQWNLVWNVDSSSKFYMYPRFLQLIIDAQVGDISSHTTKYTFPSLTQKVFANMRRVSKGFFRVDTPLFEGMLVPQQVHDDVADDVAGVVADVVAEDAVEPTPPSPTPATTPPPPQQEVASTPPSSPHQSPIAQPSLPPPQQPPSHDAAIFMDLLNNLLETCTTLTRKVKALEQDKIAQALKITKLKQRVRRLEKKRKLKVSGFKRLRKVGTAQTKIDADEDVTLEKVAAEVAKDAEVQGRLEESQAQKLVPSSFRTINRMKIPIRFIFEKHFNSIVAFLEKGKEQLEEEASKAIKRKNESSEEKATKKQKLDEEVEELKTHLQIVPNDEDDVYTEATPLALKKRLGGAMANCSRKICIFKAKNFSDDFMLNTLKAIFEKPNVKASIWKSQRGSYGLAKVKSWKLLESCGVYIITFTTTQMILLVERRYPLTRFTLDQMLNNVRLEVEEKSEVSLELLRFVRRQQQEGYRPVFGVDAVEDFKEYTLKDYYCWLKTYCCWYKLKLLDDTADIKLRLLEESVKRPRPHIGCSSREALIFGEPDPKLRYVPSPRPVDSGLPPPMTYEQSKAKVAYVRALLAAATAKIEATSARALAAARE